MVFQDHEVPKVLLEPLEEKVSLIMTAVQNQKVVRRVTELLRKYIITSIEILWSSRCNEI